MMAISNIKALNFKKLLREKIVKFGVNFPKLVIY
jgi:hypothetical protein